MALVKKLWSLPIANNLRSGFEITGYYGNMNLGKSLSTWARPESNNIRSGFEITGYYGNTINTKKEWVQPSGQNQRSGFEITGYYGM